MIKTIVELDLAGYSNIARLLEESLSAVMVGHLNDQIQGFIDAGLAVAGVSRQQTVKATTGDGAILVFEHAEQAHRFAQGVHDAARRHNATKTEASAKRWFRIGASTGDIIINEQTGNMAGISIATAVRLEANATIGCFLVDLPTYDRLSLDLKLLYDDVEQVSGKREEKFWVRRCHMIPGLPVQVKADKPQETPSKGPAGNTAIAREGRSVAIGGNASNNTFITGDNNTTGR